MSQQHVVVERLITVMQRIQHERMTGILTVRRAHGITYEEGTIVFVNGRIMQTRIGQRSGPDALKALSTWSHCSCTFSYPNQTEPSFSPGSPRIVAPMQIGPTPQTQFTPRPTIAERASNPQHRLPTQRAQQAPITTPVTPLTPPITAVLPRVTLTLPRVTPVTPAVSTTTSPLPRTPLPAPLTQLTPSQIHPVEEALRIITARGLSRTHRHLFLLVDKHRALPQLARLLKRQEHEVLALLRDLENISVITLTTPY